MLIENKIDGYILRSKAQMVQEGEKNSKYFANLEKKRAESKVISRLSINGRIITNQAEKSYYGIFYKKQEQKNSLYNFFDNNIDKLNETDQNKCDGQLTEEECRLALKEMKHQKSPGSDGITAEFYKIF